MKGEEYVQDMETSAYILPEGADIDALSTPAATTVKATSLRPGMVLLDELGCPAAIVDQCVGSAGPRTGATSYLVARIGAYGWTTETIHNNKMVEVMAA